MNILTFDIEEWFHLLDNESTKTINEWKKYESRIHANMERIFSVLEKTNTKATFFTVGWIAETYPDVVREIVDRGYELGSHTHMHQLVYDLGKKEFEKDVEHSVKTLEDITGKKVMYFRAPGFSITEKEKWAFEILAKQGIEVDCSIFPVQHAHGGFPSYKQTVPSILKFKSVELKEFPINYTSVLGKNLIFSGGGYFRLTPYPLMKHWTKKSDYLMSYLHPRDFDAGQPVIEGLSRGRKFKSYVGLKGATTKLEKWLTDFEFIDIKAAVEIIDWTKVPIVKL